MSRQQSSELIKACGGGLLHHFAHGDMPPFLVALGTKILEYGLLFEEILLEILGMLRFGKTAFQMFYSDKNSRKPPSCFGSGSQHLVFILEIGT